MSTVLVEATVYDQLEELAFHHITSHVEDLIVLDRDTLDNWPDVPFIHITRSTGTWLAMLHSSTSKAWPGPGEFVPFLFGSADRHHLLKSAVVGTRHWAEATRPCNPSLVLHYNGKSMREITAKRAIEIVEQYRSRVEAEWKREKAKR